MNNKDVLVSAELAKEKLIREIGNRLLIQAGTWAHIAQLIRNTDLTDCQPQLPELPSDQDWANISGATAWHLIERHADDWGEVGSMMEAWLRAKTRAIAPAPDQGSVRNATIPIDPSPEMLKVGAKMFYDCLNSAADFEHHAYHVYCAMVDEALAPITMVVR